MSSEEQFEQTPDEENFEQMLEDSLVRTDNFAPGDQVHGKVIFIENENIFVDISGKSEAVISAEEFRNDDGSISLKTGDEVEAYIVSMGGGEINLTSKIGRGHLNPQMLETAYRDSIPVEGRVTGTTKGGYTVALSGIQCFCPFSQIDMRTPRNEEDLVSKILSFRIIQYGEKGRKIVLSRKALLEEERKIREERLRETLNEGDIISGTVCSIQKFGIFIDIGGFEALVPRSELSWSRHVDMDNFTPGSEISSQVLSIDWENGRVTLSIRNLTPEPWKRADSYTAGQTVNGRVVNCIKTGAFVELEPGLEGFIHVSRMSFIKRINRPEDAVTIGDTVSVKILSIKSDEKRISLELLTDEPDPWQSSGDELLNTLQTGIIENVKSAGINVRLANGMLGFIPRSELSSGNNTDIQKEYQTGKEIRVAVIRIEPEDKKLILSQRNAAALQESEEFKKFNQGSAAAGDSSLGSLFKKEFDEIQKKITP